MIFTASDCFAQRVFNKKLQLSDLHLYVTSTCAAETVKKSRARMMLCVQSCRTDRAAPWAFVCNYRSLHRIVESMSTNFMTDEPSHRGRTKLTMGKGRAVSVSAWSRRCAGCQSGHSASCNARMRSSSRSMSQKIWNALMGSARMGLEQLQRRASQFFNLDFLSNLWKPAHLSLAPCWNGQALTLDNSTRWP